MSRNIKSAIQKAIRQAKKGTKISGQAIGGGICGSVVADVWLRPSGKFEIDRIRFFGSSREILFGKKKSERDALLNAWSK